MKRSQLGDRHKWEILELITDFGLSWWLTVDVSSVLGSLCCVAVGNVANVLVGKCMLPSSSGLKCAGWVRRAGQQRQWRQKVVQKRALAILRATNVPKNHQQLVFPRDHPSKCLSWVTI
jgi:hypothetical protein